MDPEIEKLFNPSMIPEGLPIKDHEEYKKRFFQAVLRYIDKWHSLPRYKTRAQILGGLTWAFRRGWVNNSKMGKFYHARGNALKRWKKFDATGRARVDWALDVPLNPAVRAKGKYVKRLKEAEDRRAARKRELEQRGF